jgi:lysozyme
MNRVILIGCVFLVLFGFGASMFFGLIRFNLFSVKYYSVHGIDVSEYQGIIDWNTVAEQNIDFAFIRATVGSSYQDENFIINWENASKTKIFIGAYHVFSFDSSAFDQAEFFIQTVPKDKNRLPPVVDIEFYGDYKLLPPNAQKTRDELAILLKQLENHFSKKPIIYSTHSSYRKYLAGYFESYSIWIRDVYFYPILPNNKEWLFWQYSDKGLLNGYEGKEKYIDLNIFTGSIDELSELCNREISDTF